MKNKIIIFILLLFIFITPTYALSKTYEDKLSNITNTKVEKDIINIYFFRGEGCPHCAREEEFFKDLVKEYDNIKIYDYEVWNNEENSKLLTEAKGIFKLKSTSVPFTVIGKKYYSGFSDLTKERIYSTLDEYSGDKKSSNTYKIPIVGEVNVKNFSLPLIAVILGFIDGFNPCAMWVLLFLINVLIGSKDKRKMFILGNIFLLTSGLVYFLSMLGISLVLNISTVIWIRNIIALIAIVIGILNIRTFIKTKNDDGCHVVKDDKRKKLFKRIRDYTSKKSLLIASLGMIVLAASVNLVELACSLGFPAVFSEILAVNKINTIERVLYLILYDLFYMLDDIVIFYIAMFTLNIKGISRKYTKYSNLVGGIIIILIGLLLLIKPNWIMFNFN